VLVSVGDVRLFVDVDGAKLVPDGMAMRERPTIILLYGWPWLGPHALQGDLCTADRFRSTPGSGSALRHAEHPAKLVLASTTARIHLDRALAMFDRLGGREVRAVAERFFTEPTAENLGEYLQVALVGENVRVGVGGDGAGSIAPSMAGRHRSPRFDAPCSWSQGTPGRFRLATGLKRPSETTALAWLRG
jgi:hypothetical protein